MQEYSIEDGPTFRIVTEGPSFQTINNVENVDETYLGGDVEGRGTVIQINKNKTTLEEVSQIYGNEVAILLGDHFDE